MPICWPRFAPTYEFARVVVLASCPSPQEWSTSMAFPCSRRRQSALTSLFLVGVTMAVLSPAAADDAASPSPTIGNFTQSFLWGKIDENIPVLLGNGDIGGLFDPFGGTTYDELRFGSGAQRDIRTLFLTQVMVPDYWVLEDQAAHFLDPRYYRPTVPRRYLTLGAPFT